jgi:hypothetical protein
MAQPQDLMSLGENPYLAARVATTVNTSQVPSNSTYALASTNSNGVIGGTQFLTAIFSATGNSPSMVLPVIGGQNGCLLGDDFLIHNGTTTTMYVFVNTGGALNLSGSNSVNSAAVGPSKTSAFYPLYNTGTGASNTGYWMGLASA